MKPAQVKPFVSRYIEERLEEWEELWYGGKQPPCNDPTRIMRDDEGEPTQNQWQETLALFGEANVEDYAHALKHNTLTAAEPLVEDFLRRYRLPVAKGSPLYSFTCRELLKAESVIATQIIERVQGRFTDAYSPGTSNASTNGDSPATVSRLLSETLKDYFTHYAHRDARTNKEKQTVFARFRDFIQGDRLLQDIAKADCVAFRDIYSLLPRRIPNKYRGRPLAEIVAGCPNSVRVTRVTVNQALTDLRHFFTWALNHDYYRGKNPVEGIDYEGVKKDSYEPFSDADLTAVFGLTSFAAMNLGIKGKGNSRAAPERYWLLLCLLYTGARREEIAALAVADIKQEEGVWFFNLTNNAERGRRLKNAASKRRVPIHSHLIELGLLEYVADLRHRRQVDFFPLVATPKNREGRGRATVGDAVAKWFSRQLKLASVTGHKTVHSFRHTVITRLTGLGVPQDMREVLVGHASDSVHMKTYTHRDALPISLLQSHLEKLNFRTCLRGLFK